MCRVLFHSHIATTCGNSQFYLKTYLFLSNSNTKLYLNLIINSTIKIRPKNQLNFLNLVPLNGTGCVKRYVYHLDYANIWVV